MLDHLDQIGFVFKQFREKAGFTQKSLSDEFDGKVSRTAIALLEQGRRTPSPETFKLLAEKLNIPDGIWSHFAREESSKRHEFETALGELVGRVVTLKMLHLEHISSAEKSIDDLFSGDLTPSQAIDSLNSLLIYYGLPQMQREFFDRYFSSGAFQSIEAFEEAIHVYQKEAIRLFSTFGEAYKRLNSDERLIDLLAPLSKRDITNYSDRTVWEHTEKSKSKDTIQKIENNKLPFLGYISVAKYREQQQKRELLSGYLTELASAVRKKGATAVGELSETRIRKLDSLMRELDSALQHTPISPLFAPNPVELETEAARILREESDLEEMEKTQSQALMNLSNYVSADYMDVYVATSMRTESDFISVNRFVSTLFSHSQIAPLRLRYFNPTQSWIEDRVAKGLVEALMLRRASYTIYMAQKSDTFGKDSEASVALGQGKPVIVFVPKLSLDSVNLDSEILINENSARLIDIIKASKDVEQEEIDSLDHDGLFTEALTVKLHQLKDNEIVELVKKSWDDFGILDESERIKGENETKRREDYSNFITKVINGNNTKKVPKKVREDLLAILSALTTNFEKRARMFRQVHPLALQVILSTGVLNGILVVRSINSCAEILRSLIENNLTFELKTETENYRLVETTTNSTIRVISRNNLLVNAFDAHYDRLQTKNH